MNGATLEGQHYRTLEMIERMIEDKKSLSSILYFLYDCQTQYEDLKLLAEMAVKNERK